MNEWKKARKKSVIIDFREAKFEGNVEVNPNTWIAVEVIHTREGILYAYVGYDYVIKGIEGELYPIDKEIFKKTYEVIEE